MEPKDSKKVCLQPQWPPLVKKNTVTLRNKSLYRNPGKRRMGRWSPVRTRLVSNQLETTWVNLRSQLEAGEFQDSTLLGKDPWACAKQHGKTRSRLLLGICFSWPGCLCPPTLSSNIHAKAGLGSQPKPWLPQKDRAKGCVLAQLVMCCCVF